MPLRGASQPAAITSVVGAVASGAGDTTFCVARRGAARATVGIPASSRIVMTSATPATDEARDRLARREHATDDRDGRGGGERQLPARPHPGGFEVGRASRGAQARLERARGAALGVAARRPAANRGELLDRGAHVPDGGHDGRSPRRSAAADG